jgi:soluble lytic murein transglycosylase-like protein
VPAVIALLGLLLGPPALAAEPGSMRVAGLSDRDATARRAELLPRGIAAADLERYRAIFAHQRARAWSEAERLIGELEDDVLLGHVLAERHLAPTAPRAGFAELADWLGRYADLPQAPRIHKLALARKPKDAAPPPAPLAVETGSARERWQRGLADWRAGDAAAAADRFTPPAPAAGLPPPARARAAFWAARANLRARRPQLVVPLLRLAAQGSDGFYGPLAQRMLEDAVAFDRAERRAEAGIAELLLRYPAARRILALAAVGERGPADAELRLLALRAPADLVQDLGAIARGLALPSAPAEPRAAAAGRARPLPLPDREPAGGYRLDPSLIHAVIRAESGFDPDARSAKGALGLMQVMPDTARHVARLVEVAYAGEDWLLEPANNMAVGQAWLGRLAQTPTVDGSLIHLLAAYNAGEGRLQRWLAGELAHAADDPLLFVESVPLVETRGYLKKVLGNLWAYQARTGGGSPSLAALAENRWPAVAPDAAPPPRSRRKPETEHARTD